MGKTRQANLDLLRIIAMFCIVIWHCNMYGVIDYNKPDLDFNNTWAVVNWAALYIVVYLSAVGVNCFVMLSGYLLANSTRYRWKSIFKTWLTTFFYSFSICLFFFCLGKTSAIDLLRSAFPVYTNQYWFMTMFIGLSLISPFLSRLATALSKRDYLILLAVLSLMNLRLFKFPYGETYGGQNTIMWFSYLYLVGAYIRKFEPFKQFHHFGKSYFIFGTLLASAYMLLYLVPHWLNGASVTYSLTFYNSFTFVTSLLLFLWAAYLRLPDTKASRIVSIFAPGMFGVYLISEHRLLRPVIWDKVIRLHNMLDNPWLIPLMIVASFAVLCICCFLDLGRISLFNCFSRKNKHINE